MVQLIECVPNFSEGCKVQVIEAIADSIRNTDGCALLHYEPGESTNRTVYTFVGSATAVVQGAFNAAQVAYKLIDMAKHKGQHPRFGAMDVCPFIPVRDATIDDCVECSYQLADKLSKDLHVPVYLYAFSAKCDERKLLPNIRSGEYEGLPEKLQNPKWAPDYGPAEFVSSWGATAVGARNFLIAYNVNLIATKEQAHKIALNIRESGRGPSKRGKLKCVQAIGWELEEHNLVQVSANITDCTVTKIHEVFEEVSKDAKELDLPVVGSEVIGLLPLQEMLEVADFYIKRENLFVLEEKSKVQLAIYKLGLSQLSHFDPEKRIIEYMIQKDAPLTSLQLSEYISAIASRKPTPGGGSVAAAVAAMGAALCTMGGQLTYGKKKWEQFEKITRLHIPPLYRCMEQLVPLVDKDARAFDSYMKALKLPATNEDMTTEKEKAKQDGILEAINIPLQVIKLANSSWESVKEIALIVNLQCASDVQVGAKYLDSGVWGAYQNILINLPLIKDIQLRKEFEEKSEEAVKESQKSSEEVLNILADRTQSKEKETSDAQNS